MAIDIKIILVKKGKALRGQEKTDEAIACFTEALSLDPEYVEALKERANTYANLGKFDEAVADYSEIIRIEPDSAEAYMYRGYAYARKNDFDKAIADLMEAIRKEPSGTESYRILGDICRMKGGGSGGAFPEETVTTGDTYRRYREKFDTFHFTGEVKEAIERELEKLNQVTDNDIPFEPNNFTITQDYLDTIFALPWNDTPGESYTLKDAERILEEDHYGLKDVKTRILEYLAVRKKKNDTRGAILCLVGPPGVGKTSVGKSIARAMNKEFFRFSVGGMSDEAELRGHRRTYIGAQPGQIIKGLKAQKTKSPVCLIDEADKMSKNSWHGNPYSALLEVLDPEQNNTFRDNYIDLPFDLSNVFFILTANELSPIPEPVRDRMEIIEIPGYIDTEKLQIARNYLIPKTLERCGLDKSRINYSDEALLHIANGYAIESGVRELERSLDKINRKAVKIIIEDEERNSAPEAMFQVNSRSDVEKYLGRPRYNYDKSSGDLLKADRPGMAIGLVVLKPVGIGMAFICEAIPVPGERGFTLTGNLLKVMRESTEIAMTYTQKIAMENYNVDAAWFEKNHIHIHFPEGATPKDGPSAGIAIAVALLSLFTNRITRPDVAMTGELTLGGRILSIGGLKEKIIGAKRNGAEHVVFPKQNIHDLDEIPDIVKEGIQFHPVERFEEVLAIALPET